MAPLLREYAEINNSPFNQVWLGGPVDHPNDYLHVEVDTNGDIYIFSPVENT
jgi:hypothetical protein